MLTATKPRDERGDEACSQLATNSFPVPCSPDMSTLASDGPMRSISCNTGRMRAESATRAGRGDDAERRAEFSLSNRCARRNARPNSIARRTVASNRALSHGFST